MSPIAPTSILDQLLQPVADSFTPEAARRLMDVRVDDAAQSRIDALADSCTEGELTADERAEYECYVHAVEMISLLQAKARERLWSPGMNVFEERNATMITIKFANRETEKRALAFLLGRFSGRVLRSGEHLVAEAALEALADQNIPFSVEGTTTYEQHLAALRSSASAGTVGIVDGELRH